MAFSYHKVLLILFLAQQTVLGQKDLLVESKSSDDVRIIADIVKNYISKFQRENRRHVSLKFTANTTGQMHKQFDLMQEVADTSTELNVTFTFLDLKTCPNQLSDLRSLNIMFVDGAQIFWYLAVIFFKKKRFNQFNGTFRSF